MLNAMLQLVTFNSYDLMCERKSIHHTQPWSRKSPSQESFPWTTTPFGLVGYVVTLEKYVKEKAVRPELEGYYGNSRVELSYSKDSDVFQILLQPSVFSPILYFTLKDNKSIGFYPITVEPPETDENG